MPAYQDKIYNCPVNDANLDHRQVEKNWCMDIDKRILITYDFSSVIVQRFFFVSSGTIVVRKVKTVNS